MTSLRALNPIKKAPEMGVFSFMTRTISIGLMMEKRAEARKKTECLGGVGQWNTTSLE